MRRFPVLALLASVGIPAAAQAGAIGSRDCAAILPSAPTAAALRPLTPEDLVRLRDIGPVEPETFADPIFTVSPDGTKAAFQLRQADPGRNAYCLAMIVLDLSRPDAPRIVDRGGRAILFTFDFRGIAGFPTGLMSVITPRWSPDGKWIAFLKQAGGTTQVWRAFADGSGSAAVTSSDTDVVDFRIGPDGSTIVYATRPGFQRQERENEKEGLDGWHYDDRFAPWISKRPLPRMPVPREVHVLDLASGRTRPPTAAEEAMVDADHQIIAGAGEPAVGNSADLGISATDLSGGARPGTFKARLANGTLATCSAAACEGATRPWWMPGRTHVRFFRREGWARGSTAIYDWDLASGAVERLLSTDDVLSSCTPDGQSLLCLVESSLRPRRLARLDPASGKRTTLFDPNPEFARLELGKAERLHWRNAFGVETIGDLVLPVGYRAGRRYPMVVVQYDTRGFLRGGTDDEYPIQAFANRGYAVLSFGHPPPKTDMRSVKDFEEAGRLELKQFANRRNVQSSLEAGVRLAVRLGVADPRRVGITGLSEGSSTVEWALSHSSLFAAAAMSSCCWDPALVSRLGPAAARHFLSEGYPGILGRNDPFWKDMALETRARSISTPILVNASEEEFLGALETYTALREAGDPIDMFVYPGEFHGRWQPAHRLATYRRSLDWFDFWLRGVRSSDPDRQSELKEWDRLKREGGQGRPI